MFVANAPELDGKLPEKSMVVCCPAVLLKEVGFRDVIQGADSETFPVRVPPPSLRTIKLEKKS